MTKDELQAKRAVALSELKNIEVALCLDEHYIDIIEKENAELKADNDARKYAMAMSEKVEKQLREQIKQIEKISDYNADQLAQAKEIIKDLMSFPVQLCDCRHTEDFEKTREKAEQFLEEIE